MRDGRRGGRLPARRVTMTSHVQLDISGHDLRLVRAPDRAQAQQARRRRRDRQLRHREGGGHLPGRRDARATWCAPSSRPGTAPRPPATREPRADDRGRDLLRRLRRQHRADGAARSVMGMAMSLPAARLPVGRAGPRHPRRRLVRAGPSTARRSPTCGTAPRRWTRWSRSAPPRRTSGPSSPSCAATTSCTSRSPRSSRPSSSPGGTPRAAPRRLAGDALRALLEAGADEASLLETDADGHDRERRVDVGDLEPGMRFVVRPGEKVATDGVVEAGSSAVDVSMLTGESVPVEVGPGRHRPRRHGQRRRPARRARHPGRRRHPARPHRAAGRGSPGGQGAGAAARRPGLRRLRPRRARPRRR